jgi:hypothetical protein
MPWNGSGTYTRGYASWTADATNGLPISATKFDTEDNDFAAGIQNCLTIDNQNKPNASLTWAQSLALTKASDATVLSIARTGGSNNPSLIWAVVDSADVVTATLNTGNLALSLNPSAYAFGNSADKPTFNFIGDGITSTVSTANTAGFNINSLTGQSAYQDFFINSVAKALIGVAGSTSALITGDALGDFDVASLGGNINFSVDSGATIKARLQSSGFFQISDNAASPTLYTAGYVNLPQNAQPNNYTTAGSDSGKSIYHASGSAHTYTIPANASVPYTLGTTLTFVNGPASGVLTIAINSDTLVWANNNTTGSRSLAAGGVATAIKSANTVWQISGAQIS